MSTTAEKNVEFMHRFCHLVQQEKRMDLFDDFIHPDFQDHQPTGHDVGADGARGFINMLHKSVDNFKVEIVNCVSQGDIIATNKIFRGDLNTEFLGYPKGGKLNLRVMDFMKLRDERVVEQWASWIALDSPEA